MKKRNFAVSSKQKWVLYARSYLSIARIAIEELDQQKYIRKTSFEYSFSYEDRLLLIPIIYNFKHAIELTVKSLGIAVDKQFINSHALNELDSVFHSAISQSGLEVSKPDKIHDLSQILTKYYKLEFWDKKLVTKGTVTDKKNDIFRFPKNSAGFILNLETLKSVSKKETEELYNDIGKIDKLLGIIYSRIGHARLKLGIELG